MFSSDWPSCPFRKPTPFFSSAKKKRQNIEVEKKQSRASKQTETTLTRVGGPLAIKLSLSLLCSLRRQAQLVLEHDNIAGQ